MKWTKVPFQYRKTFFRTTGLSSFSWGWVRFVREDLQTEISWLIHPNQIFKTMHLHFDDSIIVQMIDLMK